MTWEDISERDSVQDTTGNVLVSLMPILGAGRVEVVGL